MVERAFDVRVPAEPKHIQNDGVDAFAVGVAEGVGERLEVQLRQLREPLLRRAPRTKS